MSSSVSNSVDAYSATLTKTMLSNLSSARKGLAGTTLGNYAIFTGGIATVGIYNGKVFNAVDIYDENLVKIDAEPLATARAYLSAATVGNYALFAGGNTEGKISSCTNKVEAFVI